MVENLITEGIEMDIKKFVFQIGVLKNSSNS